MSTEISKYKPPTLVELISEDEQELRFKQDDLNVILNTNVPEKWVKRHPFVKIKINGVEQNLPYISVKKIKWLLNRIFGSYQWEIKNVGQLLNSVYVTGTLTVKNPITGETWSQDGCGATTIQMDKGAQQGDLSAIKANAIQLALPSAESYALKNAAEKFGEIFGGNIYDPEEAHYTPVFSEEMRAKSRPQYTPQNQTNEA